MDNSGYEADEKGSVHLQGIKRIKENDNLKVRQSHETYTNRSLNINLQNSYFLLTIFIVLIKLCQNQGDDTFKNHVELNMKQVNGEEEYGNNQVIIYDSNFW